MHNGTLKNLLSEDMLATASTIAGPSALRHFFSSRSEVEDVAFALQHGVIEEGSIRVFAEGLLKDLRRGVLFQHDLALAAIAVALQNWHTAFADEYLSGLAALNAAEMPYGPRVAREVISFRRTPPLKMSWLDARGPSQALTRVEDPEALARRFKTQAMNQIAIVGLARE